MMRTLLSCFVSVLILMTSSTSFAQPVVVGGSGGWDEYKNNKKLSEFLDITKSLLDGFNRNIKAIAPKYKKVKNLKEMKETYLKILVEQMSLDNPATKSSSKKCLKCLEQDDLTTKENRLSIHSFFGENEKVLIKKLLNANNLEQFLKDNQKMSDVEIKDLIDILKLAISDKADL